MKYFILTVLALAALAIHSSYSNGKLHAELERNYAAIKVAEATSKAAEARIEFSVGGEVKFYTAPQGYVIHVIAPDESTLIQLIPDTQFVKEPNLNDHGQPSNSSIAETVQQTQ